MTEMSGWSDGHRELVEGCADPVAGGGAGGEFIVTAVEVLHERMPGSHDPRGPGDFRPRLGRSRAFSRP
jgi:hypothetical protein